MFTVPLVLDFFRIGSDSLVESKTSEFLDWVVGYRKARAWAERYRPIFHDEQVIINKNADLESIRPQQPERFGTAIVDYGPGIKMK